MSRIHLSAIAVAVAGLLPALAVATAVPPTVVVDWNKAALAEVRLSRMGPPVVARALAVTHACIYEAWTPYDGRAIGPVASLQRRPVLERTDANKAKAISFAAYRCLANLFPAGAARLQAVMLAQGYDATDASTNPATPQGIGNLAATAVIASRRHDGSNQYGDLNPGAYSDYTGYQPRNAPMPFCLPTTVGPCPLTASDIYHWQPLINNAGNTQVFVAPHWARVTPFALTSASQYDSRPDVAVGPNYLQSPEKFQADLAQILQVSGALTPQQKLIVEYWADGPESEFPPGHWSLFAQQVSQRDNNSIDQDVKMFYAMQNASFDAGIVGWHLKRKFEGVRPITPIRHVYQGNPVLAWGGPGQPNQVIDGGKWSPYNPGSNLSPAFPGWISGHSVFSGASAAVLKAFTGSDYFGLSTVVPAGFGRVEPGVPAVPTTLYYPTFSAAANEAALSRLLAGIHFSDDNSLGLTLGGLTGRQAWRKAKFQFDGGLNRTTTSQATTTYARTLTWSHTMEAQSNRLLLVGLSTSSANNKAYSVTYGGAPLKHLGSQNGPYGDNRVELWYALSPTVGTAQVVVKTYEYNDLVGGAMSFAGVNQQAPFGTFRSAAMSSSAACVTLANAPAPLVATVLAANGDAWSVKTGAGQSSAWNAASNAGSWCTASWAAADVIGVGSSGPGAPATEICQTLASPKRWSMLAVPLNPAY